NPEAGKSEFYIDVNTDTLEITSTAVFGYKPFFFPGITVPLRIAPTKLAAENNSLGDVAIVVDLSMSMQAGTDPKTTVHYGRFSFNLNGTHPCPDCQLPDDFPNNTPAFPSWPIDPASPPANPVPPAVGAHYPKPTPALPPNFPADGTIFFYDT